MKTTVSLYEKSLVWDQSLQTGQENVIQAIVDHWPNGVKSALDVGCGDGKITQALASYFKDTIFHGFDESHEALSRLSISSTQGNATNLPFTDHHFDLVMTIDVLEHIPDSDEIKAWSELFRVANNWVFVTVPFMEDLQEATSKCHGCGNLYHLNWHQRSYQIKTLTERAPPGWSVAGVILSGESWSPYLPPEIDFRRNQLDEWNDWELATCPHCGAEGAPPCAPKTLSPEQAKQIGLEIYEHAAETPYHRTHTEITVVYNRYNNKLPKIEHRIATKVARSSGLIELNSAPIFTSIEPFPQVARVVRAIDGGIIVQFPCYPAAIKKNLFALEGKKRKKTTDIAAVEFTWQSDKNYAKQIKITTFTADSQIQEVLADKIEINNNVTLIKLTESSDVQKIRFDFSNFSGEERLMLRQIRILTESDLNNIKTTSTQESEKLTCEQKLTLTVTNASPTIDGHGFDKTTNGDLNTYVATIQGDKSVFVEFDLEKKQNISIEDGSGAVNYKLFDNGALLKPSRLMTPGYYGILMRLPAGHDYKSIELLSSPVRNFFSPVEQGKPSYFPLNNKLTIQVPSDLHFEIPLKNEIINKTVLMLCHDQSIDRRIISQAVSLINLGAKVILVGLSFSAEESHEITPEGIDLRRINLNHIIPNNAVYKSYIKRGQQINDLMNRANGKLNFTFPTLSKINRYVYLTHMLLTYRNRKMHDPLPFLSAFFNKCESIPCDMIQVHDLPALEAAVKLAQKKQVPIVYDAHELYPEQSSFSKVQVRLCAENEKKYIKEVDHVFTVNQSIAQEMAKRYHIDQPTTLLNALNLPEDFHDNVTNNLLHEKLNLSADRRILLFQGGLSPHRNLENLVKSFRFVKIKDVDLVILGSGSLADKLKSLAQKSGLLNKRIYFLDAVPQDELLVYTSAATMGIIPYPHLDLNSYYCTPNKLFEFIQAELPIIANDSPELRRFVKDEAFGMTKLMNSAKDIAQAIDAAFSSPEYGTWKLNLTRKNHLFSWTAEEKKYTDIMLSFLNKDPIINQLVEKN